MEFASDRSFPATLDSVARAVAWARDASAGADLPPNRLLHLELAVEEAAANVVLHAFPGRTGDFRIRVGGNEGRVRVEIEDDGIPFDPLRSSGKKGSGSTGERTAGGLGILLLHRITSELEYARDGGRNRLAFEVTR
jgi:serine/threonine-protein kinase RsbW